MVNIVWLSAEIRNLNIIWNWLKKKSTKGSNLINRKEKLEILIFYDEKIAPTFHLEMSGVPNGFFLNYDYYITY
jgi:hypothetical protein